jgi:hypothetical protein
LGIRDWGLGIGDWAQSPIPNPQIRINKTKIIFNFLNKLITILININKEIKKFKK